VPYKGRLIGEGRLDFFVQDSVVIELKAAEKLLPIHQAQLLSYLKATGCRLGLLINFHERLLKDGVRRVIHTTTGG
jgi:GxxExxY protein